MSVYVNGFNLQLNEVVMIDFTENSQTGMEKVIKVVCTYDTLKLFHKTLGEAIEQHDAKLNLLQRNKDNMN